MERGLKGAWALLLTLCVASFSITLRELEKSALKNFHQLKVERLEQEKKKQERLERLGRLLPQINLEASFNLSKKQSFTLSAPPLPPQEFVFQKGSYPKLTLQVVQNLFNLRDFREYEIARKSESLQSFLVREKENELLYNVRSAYLSALQAKATLEIYRKYLELVEAHLRDVKELYKEGIVAFKDVLETQVKLYDVKEDIARAWANFRKALKSLSYLAGRKVEDVEEDKLNAPEELLTLSREELRKRLREKRPILKYMEGNLELSEDYIKLSKASFYPVVSFEAFYQRTEESDLFPKDRYLVSIALRWNLFSGMRRFRALEMSGIAKRQLLERYRDTLEKLYLELDNVLEDIEAVRSRIELASQQLKDAKEHLRIAQEKYKAGLGTNTEVLDAQSYLIRAQNTLRIERYELIKKLFKLKEVIGDG